MKLLILSRYGDLGASSRLRQIQYINFLKYYGISCNISPFFTNKDLDFYYTNGYYNASILIKAYLRRFIVLFELKNYDLIWIEKETFPWFVSWIELFFLRNSKFVLDFDDAIFHNYDINKNYIIKLLLKDKIKNIIRKSILITSGNQYISDYISNKSITPYTYIPTVIDLNKYVPVEKITNNNHTIKIVWIGTKHTIKYLDIIYSSLKELNKEFDIILRIIGVKQSHFSDIEIEYFDWNESTEVSLISECDIGVMPLNDSEWEKGKCGYKLIQYMACSLPVIASPIGANNKIVKHDLNGFLAYNSNDWYLFLKLLINDKNKRTIMGFNGRKIVESEFSLQVIAPIIAENFLKL